MGGTIGGRSVDSFLGCNPGAVFEPIGKKVLLGPEKMLELEELEQFEEHFRNALNDIDHGLVVLTSTQDNRLTETLERMRNGVEILQFAGESLKSYHSAIATGEQPHSVARLTFQALTNVGAERSRKRSLLDMSDI